MGGDLQVCYLATGQAKRQPPCDSSGWAALPQYTGIKPISRSPLRYPGGKGRGVGRILACFPDGITRVCSPFFGGGSVELALADKDIEVVGYDKFLPLCVFWRYALAESTQLARRVRDYHPLTAQNFYALQHSLPETRPGLEQAAMFFVLNRCSYSGTVLSGGMSRAHPRFTLSSIERLANFSPPGRLSVTQGDFHDVLDRHWNDFLYLDPPYATGSRLYGLKGDLHESFDHQKLASLLTQRGSWLLSYNDCPEIRKLYRGYRYLQPRWAYGMNSTRKSNELLIFSHDLPQNSDHQRL